MFLILRAIRKECSDLLFSNPHKIRKHKFIKGRLAKKMFLKTSFKLVRLVTFVKSKFILDVRKPEQIEAGVPEVMVRVIQLGSYSVQLRAWAWAKDVADGFVIGCDLNESIKKRFKEEGVEIPYPHQRLILEYLNQNLEQNNKIQ